LEEEVARENSSLEGNSKITQLMNENSVNKNKQTNKHTDIHTNTHTHKQTNTYK